MIIDTHAHLEQFEDLSAVLSRAHEAGVTTVVAMSVDFTSMKKTLALAQQYQQLRIYPALGIHPGKVMLDDHADALALMRAHILEAKAIGETGLDYWYPWVRKDEGARNAQKNSFQSHLELSKAQGLPIVIHSRGAWRDCLEMTRAAGVTNALFHWYSGPVDVLDHILDAGFYVSTSPSVAYSEPSRLAMSHAPMERILIETDAPVYYKDSTGGFNAEPKDVCRTWQALARLKNMDEQEALAIVNRNACIFFGIENV